MHDTAPNQNPNPHPHPRPIRTGKRPNWPLILGLSALGLLWPLAELTGIPQGPVRAALVLGITGLCWIGVVGLGGFPRPVLTLTLVGVATGLLWQLAALLLGGGAPGWALPFAIGTQAGWGALAGLAAWGLQAIRGGERR